ncbi:MAG: GNAT family protein [Micrococcaceae bacterium]
MVNLRLVEPDDAQELASLYRINREHLAPWDPARDEEFYTARWQRALVTVQLRHHAEGRYYPFIIVHENKIIGCVNLGQIQRGSLDSADIGYWISCEYQGQGIATQVLQEVIHYAFKELKLHRIQASVMPDNIASIKVLEKNDFLKIGLAPQYLKVAGKWEDHEIYQRLSNVSAM